MSAAPERTVLVVGIGAGDPAQLTVGAVDALRGADVVWELARETADLSELRREILAAHLDPVPPIARIAEPRRDREAEDYLGAVADWRARRVEVWEQTIAALPPSGTGAFLVWGDPSLYDSTLAVLDAVADRGRVAFRRTVIPGVSSLHALTAAHGIPLCRVGGATAITTGRRLARTGLPADGADALVMLDGGCAFQTVREPGVTIYWGAQLGTADETLRAGPLPEVGPAIVEVRAALRARRGWVMDLYLLRRADVAD